MKFLVPIKHPDHGRFYVTWVGNVYFALAIGLCGGMGIGFGIGILVG